MNAWARRGMQAAVFTGGMLALGAGIASANECCPDRPTPPLAGVVVPLDVSGNAVGAAGDGYATSAGTIGPHRSRQVVSGATAGAFAGNTAAADRVAPIAAAGGATAAFGSAITEAVTSTDASSGGKADTRRAGGPAPGDVLAPGLATPVRLSGDPGAGLVDGNVVAIGGASLAGTVSGAMGGRHRAVRPVVGVPALESLPPAGLDGSGLPAVGTLPDVPEFPDVAGPGTLAAVGHTGLAVPPSQHGGPDRQPDCVALPGKDCVATVSEPECVAAPSVKCVALPAPGRMAEPAARVVQGAEGRGQPVASSVPAAGGSPTVDGAPAAVVDPAVAALAELDMLRGLVMELSGLVDLPVGLPTPDR